MGRGVSRGSGDGDRCETEVRDLLKERSEGQELLDLSTLPFAGSAHPAVPRCDAAWFCALLTELLAGQESNEQN